MASVVTNQGQIYLFKATHPEREGWRITEGTKWDPPLAMGPDSRLQIESLVVDGETLVQAVRPEKG